MQISMDSTSSPHIERKIKGLLKRAKLRQTEARAAILTVLRRSRKPQTAEQIAAKLAPASPDRVTIYRTLESLLAAGIVHKAFLRERTWHFELAHNCTETQCHPHFVCNGCGKTHCLVGQHTPPIKLHKAGFVVQHQQVRLEGLCPVCSKKG